MGMKLLDKTIGDMESCIGKQLLAYVSYPDSDQTSRCFSYPQYLVDDGELATLAKSAFPDNGCLPMVMSGANSTYMRSRFGNVVVMQLNNANPDRNRRYPDHESSQFHSIINPHFQRGKSDVEFASLSQHPLSSALLQVVEILDSVDLSKPTSEALHVFPGDVAPQTKLLLIAQKQGEKKLLYGPFECLSNADELLVKAVSSCDNYIAAVEESALDFMLKIVDENDAVVARFADAGEFQLAFDAAQKMDWITDRELLDVLGRVSKTGEEPFSKSQIRALKTAIGRCLDDTAKIAMTPRRRERMLELVENYENWDSAANGIKGEIIDSVDLESLAKRVFDGEHFPSLYDKIIEGEGADGRAELERQRLRAKTEESRRAAEEAASKLAQVKDELRSYTEEAELKKRALVEEAQEEVEAALMQRDALAAEVEGLKAEKKRLDEDKILVQREIRKTVEAMSDELSVASKILESEIIKQIVASVNEPGDSERGEGGSKRSTQAKSTEFALPSLVDDEASIDSESILRSLQHSLCDLAGRDLERNEVVNIMICLSQGYILTLAGLPGTGKTSLARILAGALGLANRKARRFAEVSVEKGWTSYKDFIGYYNPFTETVEKSGIEAYDAFAHLDAEAEAKLTAGEVAPYLVLLDEANLSSIEHYWSPFLKACDSFGSGGFELSLGGDFSFTVPAYVRFIATVNFDHTTEELSRRFLDRSWVVMIDPENIDLDEACEEVDLHVFDESPAFSYEKLREVFGPRKNASLGLGVQSKLKEVLDVCDCNGHSVSPRSQRMMRNYIGAAVDLMDSSSASTAYAPVDYAVAQKVLPLLSGSDERLEKLLEGLSRISGLPIVQKRVSHMLEVGRDSGFYQYFA